MSAVAIRVAAVPARRRLTSTFFAAATLAFFLPFGTVSCGAEEVTVSGVELATFTVDGADKPGSLAADVEAHGFMALAALGFAVSGAAVAWVRDRGGGYAVGGLSALFLLTFNSDTILGPDIDHGPGYVIAVLGLLAAGLARFWMRMSDRSERSERIWPWIVALVLGVPVTAVGLLYVAVSVGY